MNHTHSVEVIVTMKYTQELNFPANSRPEHIQLAADTMSESLGCLLLKQEFQNKRHAAVEEWLNKKEFQAPLTGTERGTLIVELRT